MLRFIIDFGSADWVYAIAAHDLNNSAFISKRGIYDSDAFNAVLDQAQHQKLAILFAGVDSDNFRVRIQILNGQAVKTNVASNVQEPFRLYALYLSPNMRLEIQAVI